MIKNRAVITGTVYTSMFFLGIVIAIVGAAARNIGLSTRQISILIAMQNTGFMVGVLIAGSVADAVQKPLLLFTGSLLLALSFAFFYAFEPFGVNVVVMMIMGCGIGMYEATSDSALLDLHDVHESLHINVNHMFVTIGSLGVTIYLIFLQMQWRTSMIQAAIAVSLLAAIFFFSRIQAESAGATPLGNRLRQFLGKPAFLICFVLLLIAVGTQLSIMGMMTTYLMQHRGHDQVSSKIVTVMYLSGIGVGRLLTGYFTRGGKIYRPMAVLFPLTALIAFFFFALDTGVAAYGLAMLLGLVLAGLLPLSITMVGLLYRDVSGTAMGLMKLAIPIGGIVMPLFLGALAEVFPLSTALLMVPLLFCCGSILVIAGRRILNPA